ncbi:MAG: methylenetetrahydrofolate reductase C-terminal domain-containing protein [Armatimonadota bacterium]|nr:MAG: methylenetetrahydrofolate reductase C-terminal domain-containing protein [Armatimonadota bacterium]
MIVAERKPLDEIKGFVEGFGRVLVVGCGGCATVCLAGGETEVKIVGSALRIAARGEGRHQEVLEDCVTRQCEPEFVEAVLQRVDTDRVDAVLSLACGVGVNFLAERLGSVPVFPGLNTKFLGATAEPGVWVEMCAGCGNCVLHLTGGICPVARCSKSILNGPCGGSNNGKCEISPDVDCGWELIIERMKKLGTLERLVEITPPRDWSSSPHGGPRRVVREDLRQLAAESEEKSVTST